MKILIDELGSATGPSLPAKEAKRQRDSGLNAGGDEDGDEEWESSSDEGFLDMASGMTKESLMAYGAGDGDFGGERDKGTDDETRAYVLQWLRDVAGREGFDGVFGQLNEAEQERVRQWLS